MYNLESKPKIVDCFIFYNELELLQYRLNILSNVVDYFVIVESTHTFIGKEKRLFFKENEHRFDKFREKIVHVIINDLPYIYPNIDFNKGQQWINEITQRNSIPRAFEYIKDLCDKDIIIITDLDEIPDTNTLNKIKNNQIKIVANSLEMDFYYYNLNTRFNCKWNSGKIITYGKFKELNIDCERLRRSCELPLIKRGGWHLSFFGDSNFIKNKIENFSHQELNTSNFNDVSKIQYRLENSIDVFDRENPEIVPIYSNNYLPTDFELYPKIMQIKFY